MELDLYQVDAFADKVFSGNPAAVCPLSNWLDDDLMQSIASENNLAETAFFVKQGDHYNIRWFTPQVEVDLCGHATLASAHVLFQELAFNGDEIRFFSRTGELRVRRKGELLELDFPAQEAVAVDIPDGLLTALGLVNSGESVIACLFKDDYVVVLDDEQKLTDMQPDFNLLQQIDARGVIVTSRSADYDFVNRFFAPQVGINEDPVTGSAFTKLIPYWARELHKTTLTARQVSQRGGDVFCQLNGERVLIGGRAASYMQARISV